MPLSLVGLGTRGAKGITLASLEAIKQAEKVYFETYTSPVHERLIEEVSATLGRQVIKVGRAFVEDGRQILEESRNSQVVLISVGDPLIATTHSDLRARALSKDIEVNVFHNSSILTVAYGELGLHAYRFGRMVTLTSGNTPALTAYSVILSNLLQSLHTLVLLEYVEERGYALTPPQAAERLKSTEQSVGGGIVSDQLFVIVCSSLGSDGQTVWLGELADVGKADFGRPPYCIIIPAGLHFTEEEAVRQLFQANTVPDNTRFAKPLTDRMLEKYIPKTRQALVKAKLKSRQSIPNLKTLFENVESYADDAERFLREGRRELAILSMGYAEGLLDSLRFLGILEVEW